MPATVNGPTPALPSVGGGQQIGDGNVGEPQLRPQGAEAAYTGTSTITAAELTSGILSYTGAGHNLTLPLATDLDALLGNSKLNSSFDFSVIATTGTATLVTNTGWTIVGRLTTAASTASRYRARKTAAGAWTLYLIG